MARKEYILGIDYGEKRVGIAIAHEIAKLPRPLKTLEQSDKLFAEIQQILSDEGVKLVVIGLPRSMDGGVHAQAKRVEAFARELKEHIDTPVVFVDETLTSVQAEAILTKTTSNTFEKGAIDATSAALILERYFEEQQSIDEI